MRAASSAFCYRYYYCCTASCYYSCVGTRCYEGANADWVTTQPALQDMLPPPQNVSLVTGNNNEVTNPGDGKVDYWALWVVGILGPVSSLLAMCFACGSAAARSPPAGLTGMVVLVAGLAKIGCCVCIGIQFCSAYDEGQWVYNAFEQTQYIKTYESLFVYWGRDYYYWGYAMLLGWTFAFLIMSAIWETIYGLVVMCSNNAKYTGVKEWESTGAINYAHTKTKKMRPQDSYGASNGNQA